MLASQLPYHMVPIVGIWFIWWKASPKKNTICSSKILMVHGQSIIFCWLNPHFGCFNPFAGSYPLANQPQMHQSHVWSSLISYFPIFPFKNHKSRLVSAKEPIGRRLRRLLRPFFRRKRRRRRCNQKLLELSAQAVGIHELPPEAKRQSRFPAAALKFHECRWI